MSNRLGIIKVEIDPSSYKLLYECITQVPKRQRAERMRYLASLGLMLESKGLTTSSIGISESLNEKSVTKDSSDGNLSQESEDQSGNDMTKLTSDINPGDFVDFDEDY